jgi:hypothetical protein
LVHGVPVRDNRTAGTLPVPTATDQKAVCAYHGNGHPNPNIVQGNPGAYAAAALAPGVSAAQREQLVAQHKEEQTAYADYLGSQEAGKELLLYGVGDDALAPLKKQYINFGDSTIHSMILHL